MAAGSSSGGVSGGANTGRLGDQRGSECGVCHIPYSEASVPFSVKLSRCSCCGRGKVPDILLSTVEPPPGVSANIN